MLKVLRISLSFAENGCIKVFYYFVIIKSPTVVIAVTNSVLDSHS